MFYVRVALYGGATLALATLSSPDTLRAALVASASTLFEATPFLLAGVLLASLLRRRSRAVAYLGCGCGSGPSARSLPAAAATWMLFGPLVAIARFAAAIVAAKLFCRRDACGDALRRSARRTRRRAARRAARRSSVAGLRPFRSGAFASARRRAGRRVARLRRGAVRARSGRSSRRAARSRTACGLGILVRCRHRGYASDLPPAQARRAESRSVRLRAARRRMRRRRRARRGRARSSADRSGSRSLCASPRSHWGSSIARDSARRRASRRR